ncbi:MAG TPA: hypothetical protein VLX09_02990 [Stellaceae bacterium]|nr:hypothetical protein [Stellaceae bacterium]
MNSPDASLVLQELFYDVTRRMVTPPEPLATDRWVASSALQNAIRRGESATALRAGFTYFSLDRAGFWRRLAIIAAEDVGCADGRLVSWVTLVSVAPSWRVSAGGDWQVAAWFIEGLCQALKERGMPALYQAALSHPDLSDACLELGHASDQELVLRCIDRATPLPVRAIAAWYLCGTIGLKDTRLALRAASPAGLAAAFTALDVPSYLREASLGLGPKGRYVLAAFVPLLWRELESASAWATRTDELGASPRIRGVPLYALDKHTSRGKQAIAALGVHLRGAGSTAARFLHTAAAERALELAVFHAEGARLRNHLLWDRTAELSTLELEANCAAIGAEVAAMRSLIEEVRAHQGILDEIRATLLTHCTSVLSDAR